MAFPSSSALIAVQQLSTGVAIDIGQRFWGEVYSYKPTAETNLDRLDRNHLPDTNWEAPRAFTSPWDTMKMGGFVVPGLVAVTARRAHRSQKKKSRGSDGASVAMLGFDPAEVDVSIKMWTEGQFRNFELLIAKLEAIIATAREAKPQSSASPAVAVEHPGLAVFGIYDLYLRDFTIPKATATPGVFEAIIRMEEYRPIKPNQKPIPVKSSIGNEKTTDPYQAPVKAPDQNPPSSNP